MGDAVLVSVVEAAGAQVTLRLRGELDRHTADELRRRIDAILHRDRPAHLEIDLSGVTFLDAAGSRVLAFAYKRMTSGGGTFRATGMTPQVARRLSQFGLRRMLAPEGPTP